MPGTGGAGPSVEERVRAELLTIRASVAGVHGSLVATSDGFLVSHDVPDLEPAQIAVLVATTRALANSATMSTGRGGFLEALARGGHGYLAVYAAGDNATMAVIGTSELNVGMLNYQAREIAARIATYSYEFRRWATPGPTPASARRAEAGDDVRSGTAQVLPTRRSSPA